MTHTLDGWQPHNLRQLMPEEPFLAGMVIFLFFCFCFVSTFVNSFVEPAVKAVFEIILTVPQDRTALSSIKKKKRCIE
jgi:hypothetical protein